MKFPQVSLVFLLVLACSGCARGGSYWSPSGFLHDYTKLVEVHDAPGAFVHITPAKRLDRYTMAIVEPVQVLLTSVTNMPLDLDPQALDRLSQRMERALRAALSEGYPVVEKPAFGVLRVRTAITNVEPFLTDGGVALNLDNAAFEAEVTDSLSNRPIVTFVDIRPVSMMPGARRRSSDDPLQNRLDGWGALVHERIHEARGRYRSSTFPQTGSGTSSLEW